MPYENAYAARISPQSVVEDIIVIPYLDDDDDKITAYCNSIGFDGRWIDTSYLGARRGKYAAVGDYYDEENDVFVYLDFVPPTSYIRDEEGNWVPPVPYPDNDKPYLWDDENIQWVPV